MSIRNAGDIIREARLRANMTLESMSDGICSLVTLCNIEKGTYGVSPLTFQLLMKKAGAPNEIYPIYENQVDYDCFQHLSHALFFINRWKFNQAQKELDSLSSLEYNKNKYYYQEWALLSSLLQIKKGNNDYLQNKNFILDAIHISKPDFTMSNLQYYILSQSEVNLILLYIACSIPLGNLEECFQLIQQIDIYMKSSKLSCMEKNHIYIKYSLVSILFFIFNEDYYRALNLCNEIISFSNKISNESYLFELYYSKAACLYKMGQTDAYKDTLKTIHQCEEVLNVSFLPFACSYFKNLNIEAFNNNDLLPLGYASLILTPHPDYTNGTFNIYNKDVLTIGTIIKIQRKKQKLPLKTLCQGLCSISTLHKIEKNQINPDILVVNALLNRLGLSAHEFTFFGNTEESFFYELKTSILTQTSLADKDLEDVLYKLNELANTSSSVIIKQFNIIAQSIRCPDSMEKYRLLNEAIHLTLSDFDISSLSSYRLSWEEFYCVNSMMKCCTNMGDTHLAQAYYQQLMYYQQKNNIDIIISLQLYPSMDYTYYRFLYKNHLYSNIIFDMEVNRPDIIFYSLKAVGLLYFYYAQALGETRNYKDLVKYANYSISALCFIGLNQNCELLRNAILEDFKIEL